MSVPPTIIIQSIKRNADACNRLIYDNMQKIKHIAIKCGIKKNKIQNVFKKQRQKKIIIMAYCKQFWMKNKKCILVTKYWYTQKNLIVK